MTRIFNASITARVRAAGMQGLEQAAQAILAESQRIVPVDTGRLKRSGFVEAQADQVLVGYTDTKATAAHENVHDRHPNGGRAKFLEIPLTSNAGVIAGSVVRAIRSETG